MKTEKKEIRIAGLLKTSVADGPGVRSVLFLQGCSRNCPGCQNAGISTLDGGINLPIDDLVGIIRAECKNRKLTISGGEPLEQYSALLELTGILKEDGFDLCVYTGAELEDVSKELLQNLHYIKTGRYIEELRISDNPFYGSKNQTFTTLY